MLALQLLFVLAALLGALANVEERNVGLLNRLDLVNFREINKIDRKDERQEHHRERHDSSDRSDRSDNSAKTTLTEKNDARRIALAVEAALKAAEFSSTESDAKSNSIPVGIGQFRVRLGTTNKANTCAMFDCLLDNDATGGSFAGAVAIVNTTNGTFAATFNSSGIATNPNDLFQWTIVVSFPSSTAEAQFTLSTVSGVFGVNVTSVQIITQAFGNAGAGQIYFSPLSSTFWNPTTNRAVGNNDTQLINGTTIIGCDADFDGHDSDGITRFTVTSASGALLVSNASAGTTFSFNSFAFFYFDGSDGSLNALGFENLPCHNRSRIIYDEIAIVTGRDSQFAGAGSFGFDTLDNPHIYDDLKSATETAAPSFEDFIRQLQLAAGRTQLRLRDITLDRGAFSDLSHNSKFTPCFRIYPDSDGKIEVFIGMRSAVNGGIVRGLLEIADTDLIASGEVQPFDDVDLADFTVTEIAFSTLGIATPSPVVEGSSERPYVQVDSDVTIELEDCPAFSYFN